MNTFDESGASAVRAPAIAIGPRVHDALWARFVAPVLDGREGFVQQLSFQGVTDPTVLFPPGSVLVDVTGPSSRQILAASAGWTALANSWSGRAADVWMRAPDAELLAKAVAEVRANAPVVEPQPATVAIDFWQVGSGAFTTTRTIEVPEWQEIEQHYPLPVREQVASLMDATLSLHDGRIVLWHGPPGTGKTTAIRALARAWRDSARVQVVLDPDGVLGRASTLMEVLLEEPDDAEQWRVLVIEDADELIRADAKARVGQSLSRLLNVGDGFLGQGIRVVVLITTNEPIDRLHPALSRPGRCLAQIEFRRFTRAEAVAWRGADVPPGTDFSLAELLVGPNPAPETPALTGQYL